MPELPEVEAICRKLREQITGERIAAAVVLRPGITRPQNPAEVESLVGGHRIAVIERRAKNILITLSGGLCVRIHLRMTGSLYVLPDIRLRPAATRVYFEFSRHRGLVFEDTRALGRISVHPAAEVREMLQKLGAEPLLPEFTPQWLGNAARLSGQPAKIFLMDQTRIAGLGNIYAAEALFHARVHPAKEINRLRRPKVEALHSAIVRVLQDAVQSACIAYSGPERFNEAESFQCFVYNREGQPCLICGRRVRRIPQGGRSTYYCPGCQK